MYIEPIRRYYDRDGSQHTSRANFLILVSSKDLPCGPDNFRAIVRKVAMAQCGHFMMGTARAFGHSMSLSGSYGEDGLTCDVPHVVFEKAFPTPRYLYDLWASGSGHNSAGNEAEEMVKWANENIKLLTGRK